MAFTSFFVDLEKKDRKTIVKYANNGDWICEGDMCCVMYDDGNSVTFAFDSVEFELDYHEADILLAALMSYTESSFKLVKTKTIKSL
jgi:hypothetical protein